MSLRVQELEPGVVRLALSSWRGRVVGYEVSAYLLGGVLVDSGFPGERRALVDAVRVLAPRGAVITHWHEDHSGNAPALARLGVPLLMHAECAATLRLPPSIGAYRPLVRGRTGRMAPTLATFALGPRRAAPPTTPTRHRRVGDRRRAQRAVAAVVGVT